MPEDASRLANRAEADSTIRAAYAGEIAACERLLEFAGEHALNTWSGRLVETTADRLLAVEFGRSTKTYRGSLELSLGGFGPQASMLNRSLFEGMAVAYWISDNPERAADLFEKHERHNRDVWVERLRRRGWLREEGSTIEPLEAEERAQLDKLFGPRGTLPWYGIPNVYELVKAIEHHWEPGARRTELWDYFAVPYADNNQTLHMTASSLFTNVVRQESAAITLDAGRSNVQLPTGLAGAFWTYTQLVRLIFRQFAIPALDELEQLYDSAGAGFIKIEPEVARRTGRNDPCPCGSGAKYKQCHGR